MISHYLLIFYRTFLKNKSTFFINLLGLSSGLICVFLISLWVNDELSIDKFHEQKDNLYQVMRSIPLDLEGISTGEITPTLLGETIVREIPEVDKAVTATPNEAMTFTYEDNSFNTQGKWTTPDFFNVFSYDLIEGYKDEVLSDKSSVVISSKLARILFNSTDVLGKTVEIKDRGDFVVSGVFQKVDKSSDDFDFLLPIKVLTDKFPSFSDWGNNYPRTYLILNNTNNIEGFNDKITSLIRSKSESQQEASLTAIPYVDKYLHGKFENGVQVGGRIEYVRLFSIVAILILIIACINFMNLSTAKAMRRMKEVGIKKAVGSGRSPLIIQYFFEAILMTLISVVIAIVITYFILPVFNQIADKDLSLDFGPYFMFYLLLVVFITGLLAGSYPALYLSSFSPANVLKGNIKGSLGEVFARKGLVIFQYGISIILITSVLVIYKQIGYVQNKNLGYNRDGLIYFNAEGNVRKHLETYLADVKNIPGVKNASSMYYDFFFYPRTNELEWEGKLPDSKIDFSVLVVNTNFIEMLDMKMKSGRSFTRDHNSDVSRIIFNEKAIDAMNLKDPIGKTIKFRGKEKQIVGVVQNFHFESLYKDITPLFFLLTPENNANSIMVKIDVENQKNIIANLQDHFKEFNPGFPFNYKFVDDEYQSKYASEQRVSVLSQYFAGLAIIISCLGLFGLAAFTAERRLKEIGIRKALGSSNFNIFYLLSIEFIKILVVAIIIATPISYIITKKWLENFSYRIDLEPTYFILAGLLSLFIALFTVGLQITKVARVDPVDCLRDE
ncbi:ABC transporter permease [Aquimarina spongiae]|uniref:ABC-type antimicrobial peptide transport system, permease component n=1 Tax=Aquimarina spongiae TaxID=570521 RepID=A0A1M6LHT8_9FLAO|nr:ABC transporter permease [Aquimarina spongiae]SHJ70723.1 ABC-type antimicrobial peptide transport system, permease component [Aquimarina spongiae]